MTLSFFVVVFMNYKTTKTTITTLTYLITFADSRNLGRDRQLIDDVFVGVV